MEQLVFQKLSLIHILYDNRLLLKPVKVLMDQLGQTRLEPVSYTHLYAARYIAKNIVAAGLAKKAEVQLAYAIGVAQPVSVRIDTFGTGTVAESKLEKAARQIFDLRPAGIIQMLDLKRPIYRQTAAYGHMGRTDIDLPWERLDKVEALKEAVK